MDASNPYAHSADKDKHWECARCGASGAAKNLKLRLRQATHRIPGVSDGDADQVRFIGKYLPSVI